MHDWTTLYPGKEKRSLIDELVVQWSSTLRNASLKEESYQKFISENAGLFFGNPFGCLMCISKFEFGNEHKADFVVPHDEGSYGFVYEIVEIESPHDPAFTKAGLPSQHLLGALKQISDWRRWLLNNDSQKRKLLASKALHINGDERFNFGVYISRREHLKMFESNRYELEKLHNITIRSFDKLTESLEQRPFFNATGLASAEEDRLSIEQRNELANPFFSATTFKEWKELCSSSEFHTAHMYAMNAEHLLAARHYSPLFSKYLE